MMTGARLGSCAIVFLSGDIERTAAYYHDVMGFRVVEHYQREEKFAALYRDAVEIILVQTQFGSVDSNMARHGAGFDGYLVPENPEAVVQFHEEIRERGARIIQPPTRTSYGSLEFVLEDIDGRRIGVGCIVEDQTFFGMKG